MPGWATLLVGALSVALAGVAVGNQEQATTLLVQAEHTTLSGPAQAQVMTGRTWTLGGSATWDVITPAGNYRLLLRVRAGTSADHELMVRGETWYPAQVDGRPVSLKLVPDTLVYYGDDSNWAWLVGEVGALDQGPHEVVFSSSGGWGCWDLFILTSDPNYTPKTEPPFGDETAPDLSLLNTEQKGIHQGFTLWIDDIEKNCPPSARPQDPDSVKQLALTACQNEHVTGVVNLTNWRDELTLFRVASVESTDAADELAALPSSAVRLLHAVPLAGPLEAPLADALPELDSAGLLVVPAGETRQVWLDIATQGLPAGRYGRQLRIQAVDDAPKRCTPQAVQIELIVLPLTLPLDHPLSVFTFEYQGNYPGADRDMPAHYVNWYHNCAVPSPADPNPDYSAMDQEVRREMSRPNARQVFFEHWWFRQDDSWKDPANRAKWVAGVRRWARHVHEDLGLGYDQFVLHTFDETHGAAIDDYLLARELVREADPNVREIVTIGTSTTLADVKRQQEAADVWAPYIGSVNSNPEMMAFLRETGKPICAYHCDENKRYWPAQKYRVYAWEVYRARVQGLWMYTYYGAAAWDGRAWDGGMVFPGNDCIVTSRRWELLRMGMQDWLLLDTAEKAGNTELVNQAVGEVLAHPEDAELLRQWRDKVRATVLLAQ